MSVKCVLTSDGNGYIAIITLTGSWEPRFWAKFGDTGDFDFIEEKLAILEEDGDMGLLEMFQEVETYDYVGEVVLDLGGLERMSVDALLSLRDCRKRLPDGADFVIANASPEIRKLFENELFDRWGVTIRD